MPRVTFFLAAAIAGSVAAPAAIAAPSAPTLELRGAAARLVVIPEARSDIAITLTRASARLPIRVRTFGRNAVVMGDVGRRVHSCRSTGPLRGVGIWGRGMIAYDALPIIVARTPMDVKVSAGDAVFGDIGRSGTLDLTNRGCGGWTVANVAGRARIDQTGSGDTRAGGAGEADLSVAGSGDISLQTVRGGVTAVSSGSGNITLASLRGPLDVRIAGSGDVKASGGVATQMKVSIAGSGGVRFGGVAHDLDISIAGSGDVDVARADGPVKKRVFGSGDITIGH